MRGKTIDQADKRYEAQMANLDRHRAHDVPSTVNKVARKSTVERDTSLGKRSFNINEKHDFFTQGDDLVDASDDYVNSYHARVLKIKDALTTAVMEKHVPVDVPLDLKTSRLRF